MRLTPELGWVKFSLAAAVVALTMVILAAEGLVLEQLAGWAERERDAYPYVAGEDPIRLLLPDMFDVPGEERILILGASAAHEGILYEEVERAFPAYDVLTVGISTGTMDDVLLALDLIERRYGADKLPRTLILGLTFRLVANVPRRFGDGIDPNAYAPLHEAIRRYSPYDVVPREFRSELVDKGTLGKLKAAFKLRLMKAQPRFRAGLAALAGDLIGEHPQHALDAHPWVGTDDYRRPLTGENLGRTADVVAELGLLEALRYWLPFYRSPYYTAYRPRAPRDALHARLKSGWIPKVGWDGDEAFVGYQLRALRQFCERHGIRLFAVNLAESPVTYAYYPDGAYARYRALLAEHLEGVPFLDLREALAPQEFMDEIHPLHPVARRYTKWVVDLVRAHTPPGFGQAAPPPR